MKNNDLFLHRTGFGLIKLCGFLGSKRSPIKLEHTWAY